MKKRIAVCARFATETEGQDLIDTRSSQARSAPWWPWKASKTAII